MARHYESTSRNQKLSSSRELLAKNRFSNPLTFFAYKDRDKNAV
jgi:hypothetical protein